MVGKSVWRASGICGKRSVPIHLVVRRDTPPGRISSPWSIGLVERVRRSVQLDGLVEQRIVVFTLQIEREVVPTVDELAGHARGNPKIVHVVPDVPVSIPKVVALGSPNHPDAVHVHAYIEFQDLRDTVLRHIKVTVISEVMNSGQKSAAGVRRLRGILADQLCGEQCIRIGAGRV